MHRDRNRKIAFGQTEDAGDGDIATWDPSAITVGGRDGPTNPFERFDSKWTEIPLGECFRLRSRRYPERTALCLDGREIRYGELDSTSDAVAEYLTTKIGSSSAGVALALDHETEVPAAIIGAAKAGKFFVPIDPSYPRARNKFILEDTEVNICITSSNNFDAAKDFAGNCRLITLEEIVSQQAPNAASDNTAVASVSPDDLLQIMYTSGSSGAPKGVMRTHRMVVSNAMRHTNTRHITEDDRVALLFSYSFGAAMSNVFATLLNGGTLLPFNLRDRGVEQLALWLGKQGITQFHIVPTAFRRVAKLIEDKESLARLRLVQLGGEPMYRQDLDLFREHFPDHCLLGVGMGTSETGHVLQCFFRHDSDFKHDRLPAGYPSEGCEVMLLDENGEEAGPGEIGEIVVRGDFLAAGYWRRPELTAQVFDSMDEDVPDRTYRSGDLGSLSADGCIFHIGRKDDRVKVRGYRIETGEIEARLRAVYGVVDAAVVVVQERDGDTRLVAAVVLDDALGVTPKSVRQELRKVLPDYMLPSSILPLDLLPMLPNGKVDRSAIALRARGVDTAAASHKDIEGTTQPGHLLGAQLCGVWEDVLRIPTVGVDEDFYDLGGDSLLAADMFAKVEDLTGIRPKPTDFLDGLTIERLSESVINHDRQYFVQPIVRVLPGGTGRPYFFHSGDLETGGLYCRNLARHLKLDGPFYAILGHGVDGRPVPATMEQMAADALEHIIEIQPEGPYRLGGFCYGGLVAYEMARQLRRRGERVESIVMIDTKSRYTNEHVGPWMRLMWRLIPSEEVLWYRRLRRVRGFLSRFRRFGMREASRIALNRLFRGRRNGDISSTYGSDSNLDDLRPFPDRSGLLDDGSLFELTHVAIRKYVPTDFGGRVVLLYSSRTEGDVRDNCAGWADVARAESLRIPGDHRSCVTKHVANLAETMRPYLLDD